MEGTGLVDLVENNPWFGSNQGTALSWGEAGRDHFCWDIVRREGKGCQSSTASVTTCVDHDSFSFCGCPVVPSTPLSPLLDLFPRVDPRQETNRVGRCVHHTPWLLSLTSSLGVPPLSLPQQPRQNTLVKGLLRSLLTNVQTTQKQTRCCSLLLPLYPCSYHPHSPLFLLSWQCTPARQEPAPVPAEGGQGAGRTCLTSLSKPTSLNPRGWALAASLSAEQLVPHNQEQEGNGEGDYVWSDWALRGHFPGGGKWDSNFTSTIVAATDRK